MKMLIFVSTGRCGTTRLAEIFREVLPKDEFSIEHQVKGARWNNIQSNIMYHFGTSEEKKERLFQKFLNDYATKKHFISTDPLSAMLIPKKLVESDECYIIHIERSLESFAKSFYNFSRKKRNRNQAMRYGMFSNDTSVPG